MHREIILLFQEPSVKKINTTEQTIVVLNKLSRRKMNLCACISMVFFYVFCFCYTVKRWWIDILIVNVFSYSIVVFVFLYAFRSTSHHSTKTTRGTIVKPFRKHYTCDGNYERLSILSKTVFVAPLFVSLCLYFCYIYKSTSVIWTCVSNTGG